MLRFRVADQIVDHSIKITQDKQDYYVRLTKQPTIVRFDPEAMAALGEAAKKEDHKQLEK